MEKLYKKVLKALQQEDEADAVMLCIDALKNNEISVVDLYQQILTPALANIIDEYQEDEELIWREHVRSRIVRTIIESAYPYILEEKKPADDTNKKVIVMCPEFEDHELGAKMVSDFFKLEGFHTTFIGARTPIHTVLKAIEIVEPHYLCISVTNYYNLVSVKRTIETIKEKTNQQLIVILGGRAIDANPDVIADVGADMYLKDYDDIKLLGKEGK